MIIEKQHLKQQNTKLYVPTVTFSTKDDVKLTKELNGGFKRTCLLE